MRIGSAISELLQEPMPIRRAIRAAIRNAGIGSFEFRYQAQALHKMAYAYIIYQSALLARRLGQPRISVLEFGVAGGNGLLQIEKHAASVERLTGVKIEIYGFDTGAGLPPPEDYRDLPYHWQESFFAMEPEVLQAKLTRAKLVFGNVRDTVASFFEKYNPAPVGAISHDMDFYSSTRDGLTLFDQESKNFLPRVFCYFDDVIGDDTVLYSDYTGERFAIHEFNEAHADIKIAPPAHLRFPHARSQWQHQIWVGHLFQHAQYNSFISRPDQQLKL